VKFLHLEKISVGVCGNRASPGELGKYRAYPKDSGAWCLWGGISH
jgi:hypothetical protein